MAAGNQICGAWTFVLDGGLVRLLAPWTESETDACVRIRLGVVARGFAVGGHLGFLAFESIVAISHLPRFLMLGRKLVHSRALLLSQTAGQHGAQTLRFVIFNFFPLLRQLAISVPCICEQVVLKGSCSCLRGLNVQWYPVFAQLIYVFRQMSRLTAVPTDINAVKA